MQTKSDVWRDGPASLSCRLVKPIVADTEVKHEHKMDRGKLSDSATPGPVLFARQLINVCPAALQKRQQLTTWFDTA